MPRVDVHKAELVKAGYADLEDWLMNPLHIYVGRRMPIVGANMHEFANIFTVKNHGRKECINLYRAWLKEKLRDADCRARFQLMNGKTLGCWCKLDEACHADIILHMLKDAF